MNTISEKVALTKARRLLIDVKVLRKDENGHSIVDVSLLRDMPDNELEKYRGVGKTVLAKVREIRRSFDWVL